MNNQPIPLGNYFNKHTTRNPLFRFFTDRYRRSLQEILKEINPHNALEVGSGEGYIIAYTREVHPSLRMFASDIDWQLVKAGSQDFEQASWTVCYGESLPYSSGQFDLVMACEVLEHVPRPDLVMEELRRVGRKWLIASVPHEPWWRLLNMARLRYLKDFGNTPGHIQHWGMGQFGGFLSGFVRIKHIQSVFPWTFVLGTFH